jgi:sodium-dependent dicarboxylate transporter 2/3/5
MAKTFGFQIGFGRWMLVGVPLSLVLLACAWFILTRIVFRVGREHIAGADTVLRREFSMLGRMSAAERRVLAVFAVVAVAWMTRPLLNDIVPALSDAGIAVIAALALFVLPAGDGKGSRLMNWDWASRLPWGVLVLFGGGLSLASAIQSSGLAQWIGDALALGREWPVVAILLLVTVLVVFLTELTSNTATAAVFLPVVAALAGGIPLNPLLLTVPAALAASCAFMLPVATPPNAIVFSSGHVSVPEMARAGILLNITAIALIAVVAYSLLVWVFGVAFDAVPDWAASPRP